MVDFWVYDVSFLILFTLIVVWIILKKKGFEREGIMFMYRTKFGMRAIDYVGTKCKKLLRALKYPIIVVGFGLMISMLYLLWDVVYKYITIPQITEVIRAPPIAPVIPYFPKLFGLESFFPPFYFTYFILALAIVAIVHEFSHGIYMKLFGVKIKSTGVVFLGPIFGAFVEEDRNSFVKKKKTEQMTILAAGTFANTITSIVFYLILVGFFFSFFVPSGYIFNTYATNVISTNSINSIENVTVNGFNYSLILSGGEKYYLDSNLERQLKENMSVIAVYEDTPAFNNQIRGAIISIDNNSIENVDGLKEFLSNKSPNDKVMVRTITIDEGDEEKINEYNVTLSEHPLSAEKAYLGVGNVNQEPEGFLQKALYKLIYFKDPTTYYESRFDGNFTLFIYNLIWWVMIINILVALFNMLPVGILDGGRFFYLIFLGITKSEKFSKGIYKLITWLILASFVAITLVWLIRVI